MPAAQPENLLPWSIRTVVLRDLVLVSVHAILKLVAAGDVVRRLADGRDGTGVVIASPRPLVTLEQQVPGNLRFGADDDDKCRANIELALHLDFTGHLFHDLLANAQAEAGPRGIHFGVFVQLVEIDE